MSKTLDVFCMMCDPDGTKQVGPITTITLSPEDDYEEDVIDGTCDGCYKKIDEASKDCFNCSEHRRMMSLLEPNQSWVGHPTWICGARINYGNIKYCKTIKWIKQVTA